MKALIVIDVQNEFTESGQRPVPQINEAASAILKHVEHARAQNEPIVWIRHFNRPHESPAFVPGTWGAEFISGFGPISGALNEVEMHKDVFGAFTGTDLEQWLNEREIREILVTGFYTHGCVSTTCREGLMRNLTVYVDPDATASCEIAHEKLGTITAVQSRNAALLQLANMGVNITSY